MSKGCGNCFYHGDTEVDNTQRWNYFCLLEQKWTDGTICSNWQQHSSHLGLSERSRLAQEKKRQLEEDKRQALKIETENKKISVVLRRGWIQFLLGILVGILISFLTNQEILIFWMEKFSK